MKMKKLISLGIAAALAATALTACSSNGSSTNGDDAASGDRAVEIGISKFMEHPSLNAAIDGFKAALEDKGVSVNYDEKDANGDRTVAASIAGAFKSTTPDLVLGVGTDSSQALAQALTDIPVLFTAVTDPVDAGLVDSWESPGANVTGTSDANPVKEQLALIQEINPATKTVGVVYSSGEANSLVQVAWAEAAAAELGLDIVTSAAADSKEVQQATQALAGVDAIYVPTDNTVVTALETVLQFGEDEGIPVYGAEGDSVARGAVATYGLDYYSLGYQTGLMAFEILDTQKSPADIPVATLSDPLLYLNLSAAQRMGVTFPQELIDRADPENITE